MSKYYEKYIKYKSKYNLVKEQMGGISSIVEHPDEHKYTPVVCITKIPEIDFNNDFTKNTNSKMVTYTAKSHRFNFRECFDSGGSENSVVGYDIGTEGNCTNDDNNDTLFGENPNRTYENPLSVLHNSTNRTYSVVFISKFQPSDTGNSERSRPRIVLIFKEALTSKTLTEDISLIAYKGYLGIKSKQLLEYKLKGNKNIKFMKGSEESTFTEFHKYITNLGVPKIFMGLYNNQPNIERYLYPEFHKKLNTITINFTINEISGVRESEHYHELKIKDGLITINFPQL